MRHYDGRVTLFHARSAGNQPDTVEIQDADGNSRQPIVKWTGFDGTDRSKQEVVGNARRLVACWNAMHGISTAEVERIDEAGHFGSVRALEQELRTMVDELRAASKQLETAACNTPDGPRYRGLVDRREAVDAILARYPERKS